MTNLTTEEIAEIQRIVEGAPDDSWSYYSEPSYLRETESSWDYCCPEYGWMEETELHDFDNLRSRKDIETIIAQHEEIERLRGGLNQAIELLVTALAEPEQITDSEIVQLRKIEKGEQR